MKFEDLEIISGTNLAQKASIEQNEKMIDYETSKELSYADIISIYKGLNLISEFYDVLSVVAVTPIGICSVALGKTTEEAIKSVIDSNPIDFMSSTIVFSKEVDSDAAKMVKESRIVVAPKFTKNAIDYLDSHDVCYVTIHTDLKDYKNYLSNEIVKTPLGTLIQTPNLSELNKDTFTVVTKLKPTVEQIEDAVFAWKVAKHTTSRAIVIAKDLKTTAIAQGLQAVSIEYALDYSCDCSKESILATDMEITVHDVNVAAQGRVALLILPNASKELIDCANKYNMVIITTGFTNILL